MSDLELDAIEARCKNASPGPWITVLVEDFEEIEEDETVSDACHVAGPQYVEIDDYSYFSAQDAAFVANAITDVPALVAEVRRLNSHIARLRNS